MENIYGNLEGIQETAARIQRNKISENVKIANVEYKAGVSKAGNPYESLQIHLERENGSQTETHTESIMPIRRWDGESDESFRNTVINFNSALKHILTSAGGTTEQFASLKGNSFKEFAEKYAKLIMAVYAGQKFYWKMFSNTAGYACFPRFTPFIQPMDGECSLSFTNFEKKAIQKMEGVGESGMNVSSTQIDDFQI